MDPRASRTHDAVLSAAFDLFLAEGLAAITHSRVAETSGVARRTIYRHWATRRDLLRDTLAAASYPTYEVTGNFAPDARTHLHHLRDALDTGPLARILLALGELAPVDPAIADLRDELVIQGCAPLRTLLLRHGVPQDRLDDRIHELEGPVISAALVHGRRVSDEVIQRVVDRIAGEQVSA